MATTQYTQSTLDTLTYLGTRIVKHGRFWIAYHASGDDHASAITPCLRTKTLAVAYALRYHGLMQPTPTDPDPAFEAWHDALTAQMMAEVE